MKSKIALFKSRKKHIGVMTSSNRGATSPPHGTTPHTHFFLEHHPNKTTTQDSHQILTLFQLLNPIGNNHVKEMEKLQFPKREIIGDMLG